MNKIKKVFNVVVLSCIIVAANVFSYIGGQNSIGGSEYSQLRSVCLPDAIGMKEQLNRRGVSARILIFSVQLKNGAIVSHAVCLFNFGANTYCWDREGSLSIPPIIDNKDPVAIVKSMYDYPVLQAKFLDN